MKPLEKGEAPSYAHRLVEDVELLAEYSRDAGTAHDKVREAEELVAAAWSSPDAEPNVEDLAKVRAELVKANEDVTPETLKATRAEDGNFARTPVGRHLRFLWFVTAATIIGLLTYGQQVREGTLKVGDAAPRVPLIDIDGMQPRELGEWIGERPLVLVFGSFT